MNKRNYFIKAVLGIFLITIILIVFFIPKRKQIEKINVISTIPKNGDVFVPNKQEITIVLNKNISLEEGNYLKISFDPEVKVNTVFLANKIRITPENIFDYGTKYSVKVNYKDSNMYEFSFTTNPFTPEQIKDEGSKQTTGDLAFNQTMAKLLQKYPWYNKLPIETSEYRIVYNDSNKMFRIRLLQEQKDQNTIDRIIEEALLKLEKIGVQKPIKYYILQPY